MNSYLVMTTFFQFKLNEIQCESYQLFLWIILLILLDLKFHKVTTDSERVKVGAHQMPFEHDNTTHLYVHHITQINLFNSVTTR